MAAMNALLGNELMLKVLTWAARVLAVVIFLFWGAFFVEHTAEWFVGPYPRKPPPAVWLGHGLHLLMLVSLLVVLRWPVAGTLLLVASALAFFAGRTGSRFPLFFGVTCLPALILLFCWWRLRHLIPPGGSN